MGACARTSTTATAAGSARMTGANDVDAAEAGAGAAAGTGAATAAAGAAVGGAIIITPAAAAARCDGGVLPPALGHAAARPPPARRLPHGRWWFTMAGTHARTSLGPWRRTAACRAT